jgi:hypothetical protein
MAIVEILLLRFLLRQQQKERQLLRFLGLGVGQIKKVDYQELVLPCLFFSVVTLLLFYAGERMIPFLNNMMQYETAGSVSLYFIYNGVVTLAAVAFFHRKLSAEHFRGL